MEILVTKRIEWFGVENEGDGVNRGATPPLVNLGMSISERETTRAVVKRSREVSPLVVSVPVVARNEKRVVIRIRVFIDGHPCHGGIANGGLGQVLHPLSTGLPRSARGSHGVSRVSSRVIRTQPEIRVHRVASNPCGPTGPPLYRTQVIVGRALVNPQRVSEIRSQHPFSYIIYICVVRCQSPVNDIIHPVLESFIRDRVLGPRDSKVIGHVVSEIKRVLVPSQNQLLIITQALYSLRLGFCFAQCGQNHAGQDGNDSDDHQELNERECMRAGDSAAMRPEKALPAFVSTRRNQIRGVCSHKDKAMRYYARLVIVL